MNAAMLLGSFTASLTAGTTLLYATLGEVVSERAGIINLGLEGLMLVGASCGFAATAWSGSPLLGLGAAAVAGALLNMIFAYAVIERRASQPAAGLTVMFLCIGVSALVGKPYLGALVPPFPSVSLRSILPQGLPAPRLDALMLLALPLTFLVHGLLFRTSWGLRLRAVGEDSAAAFAAGCNPKPLYYQALIIAGILAGLAGAHLSLAVTLTWAEGMTGGRGFIAIALVIFARWRPFWAMVGALIFGGAEALQLQLQASGTDLSPFIMNMLPYLLTLAILLFTGIAGRAAAPASLGRTFRGVE
jgi:general nucleoside transport system permease protein